MNPILFAEIDYKMPGDYDGIVDVVEIGDVVVYGKRDFENIVAQIEQHLSRGWNIELNYTTYLGERDWTDELDFILNDVHDTFSVRVRLRYAVRIGEHLFELPRFEVE